MSVLVVPPIEDTPYPSLGPQVVRWIEANLVFGPGDLRGLPARVAAETAGLIYRAYEIFPPGHPNAGRRRWRRVAWSKRKGSAKTEQAAWIGAAELHPDAPVRCVGWDQAGNPIGGGVTDPSLFFCAYTEEQSEDLAFGALRTILELSAVRSDFDIGLERILVKGGGGGKATAVATAPDARDGARVTWQHFDEALALDTPLPTPTGWTTIGAVGVGDQLLGRDGAVCTVLGKSPVHLGRPCYRVEFGEGSSITVDAGHLWYTKRRGGCGHGRGCRCATTQGWAVRRTEEMVTTGVVVPTSKQTYAYRVPITRAAQLPMADLPLHPYLLGLWLGDGDARNATIAVGKDDVAEISGILQALGYRVTRCTASASASLIYVTLPHSRLGRNGDSVCGRLRKLGVLRNKHIPMAYLRSSINQRIALLQGLMDSDGHITGDGWCTFINTEPALVNATAELVRTLGISPRVTWRADNRRESYKSVGKVCFQTDQSSTLPFRLDRKSARIPVARKVRETMAIRSITPVASVAVQCIAVDSADHLFLAGEGMVPTHNTHRFHLPRLKLAHRTMLANLPKRRGADPWALETTTAYADGEGSVAEDTMTYARAVLAGERTDPRLFFFHRQAGGDEPLDLSTRDKIREAVLEASGPGIAEWSDIDGIVDQWDDPTADRSYLERVWLNRPGKRADRAFSSSRWAELVRRDYRPEAGALIAVGFDGSRTRDATAIVCTEIVTGFQWLEAVWERPRGVPEWEVPVLEVSDAIEALMTGVRGWTVWRLVGDASYWESEMATWAGRWRDRVLSWPTHAPRRTGQIVRAWANALATGGLSHDGGEVLARHVANAQRKPLPVYDDDGERLWWVEKPDELLKIDAVMAAILSWEGRRAALEMGVTTTAPIRSALSDPDYELTML